MAAAQQIVKISDEAERAICMYAQKAHELLLNQFSLRSNLENIDRYYQRETDWTESNIRAKIANRLGNKNHIQDITVPVVMPQVQAALGYLANVFLTGYPLFGVSGDPSNEDAALQMETIITENSITAAWTRQLIMFFRDGLKYNLHGIECEWQQKNVASIDTDVSYPNSAKPKTTLWKGNVLRRMDMYNTFFDPRVHPAEVHTEGEYAGYIDMMSRVRMKKMTNDLYGQVAPATLIRALESGPAPGGETASGSPFTYYVPQINPYPIMNRNNQQTFDWLSWAEASLAYQKGKTLQYKNVYEVMKIYARIIPADFGLHTPAENTPQIWKFIIINGQVILFAERQSNAHNYIPIFFGQPIEDGLDYQTKSFASNVIDLQDIASTMLRAYVASKRRLIGDRVLYDPLRINKRDITSINPEAKIPVRPSAYGKPVGEAVYQFPFHDEQTQTLLQGSDLAIKYADMVNGQNPSQRGQFVKGNKTLHEYDDVMGHGNTDNQLMGMEAEAQVFTPMKEAIKLNILQYQEEDTIYNPDKKQAVKISPVDLRKAAVSFKVSDGMIPADKEMSTDEFQTALQMFATSPALAAGYNLAPLFTYIMKLRGADLSPFEKPQWQTVFEQQMGAWQQAAQAAIKAGTSFSTPMPQLPPQLQQLAQQQQGTAVQPSATNEAAQSTQGANNS